MIKELFLAIILGALLGFGVTGGYFALQKNKTPSNNTNNITPTMTVEANQVTPTVDISQNQENNKIVITSPENNTIVSTSKIAIKGSAPVNSTIIITTLKNSYTAVTDSSGSFTSTIDLESGVNEINLTAIESDDNQIETQLSITYSTAKI